MFRGLSGHQRVAPLAERRLATQLREALATLPSPWIVLANRRASGADGPPWVRFVALHPAKGIALVDTTAAEAALAPLEDFLARTGFPALQPGALPIVPVAIGPSEIGAIADMMDSAFPQGQAAIGNPNWCDAVVELLLSAPDLMLSPLRRNAQRPAARPSQPEPSFRPAQQAAPTESPRPQPSRAEPPRPEAVAVPPQPPTPEAESESIRLVPRRVARQEEPQPQSQPQPQPELPPRTPDVPQFLLQGGEGKRDEPWINLALEAGDRIGSSHRARTSRGRRDPSDRRDPTFGAGAGFGVDRDDASWRRLRMSRSRSALIPIAAGLLLVAAGAVALRYHQITSSQSANAVAQSAPPSPTASLTPPAMPSPLPTVSPAPVVTPAATAPAPPPRPAPPTQAVATPPHPAPMPPVKKADADLPRDMLQPQIASAPPTPAPLPAAKQHQPQPVRTATAKPQSTEPAPADTDLPAAIAAVLHPGATPPDAPTSTNAAPQVTPPSATAATAVAPAGGEVTVNGVSYVNGEQPHSLGALGAPSPSTSPTTPSPAAVASNAPPPAAAVPPGEVVISRAPNGTPITQPKASGPLVPPTSDVISTAPGYSAAENHPSPGGIVATPVPGPTGSDNGNDASASGPPTALQAAPASSNP